MQAHEHFAEGQRNLAQAASATQPERLIGLAQGHFLAAQTLIAAGAYAQQFGLEDKYEAAAWTTVENQQFGPDGKLL
jgi:hypothetical protein